ncbi:MipA/OmpV family protein [Yoonia sp.]|uniref:MipA/OmpV family protein n=1 Tax=Yoonia sp. TaxID=2212373 RepID=UPI002FDAC05F
MFKSSLFICLVCAPVLATAQDGTNGISFWLGIGPQYGPGYFGADEPVLGTAAAFSVERFQFGTITTGGEPRDGVSLRGSIRYIDGRSADDFDELAGLADIDPSLELGGSIGYRTGALKSYLALRYGVLGHEAVVAELGTDYAVDISPRVTITAGPRALWGDDRYARTYFGVSPEEAGVSAFDAFDADAGFVSAGLNVEARYAISDNWAVVGTITYDRLLGDAADSPITVSDDQISTSITVSRRFTFGF